MALYAGIRDGILRRGELAFPIDVDTPQMCRGMSFVRESCELKTDASSVEGRSEECAPSASEFDDGEAEN